MDELYQLSLAITTWLQENYPQLVGLMAAITALGEELFYLAALPAVYWSIDKRLGRQLGYIFLLSAATNNIAKNLFRQPRPFWLDPSVRLREAESYGLPSGHAQHATAVYLLLAAWVRRSWVWLPAFVFILLMALSRVYLGVHFIQDVVVGFMLGLLVLGVFLFWQRAFAERFSRRILGRRLLIMITIPAALAVAYVGGLFLLGAPDLDVPWAEFVPAAELTAHEDVVATVAGLLGFGVGMILESSRIRFRSDGPVWKRVVRYALGIAVALGIWSLRAVLPAEPEWAALPLRFLRYLLLLLWVTYFGPWVFVKLRLAEADAESEVRIALWQ
ncbi:MAG: phosphatase PAP2 family protein [Candidatus Promineofilum sp.]|nr:phosphatase PAP2 family protein [Promineifilum sp.]